MSLILAAVVLASALATPTHTGDCVVTPSPVVWTTGGTPYTVTAQLRAYGWYSVRIDVRSRDHFGHHAEGAPLQLGADGLLEWVGNTSDGPRDSLFPGDEASVHVKPADGTGGGGAHCGLEVV